MAKKQKDKGVVETPAATEIIRANLNRQVKTAETFVSLYSNDTQVQMTPWDFRLIFGMVVGAEMDEQNRAIVQIKTVGDVRMSPQHAKQVALILVQQLKLYEETVGPIPLPD